MISRRSCAAIRSSSCGSCSGVIVAVERFIVVYLYVIVKKAVVI